MTVLTDASLPVKGAVVAFSERTGGVSESPYAGLDLASHTGDDPSAVDENRRRLLSALDLAEHARRLTLGEQVHGSEIAEIDASSAGSGRSARGGPRPIPGVDAMMTVLRGVPLMMLFADCVPVVLVALGPVAGVCVAHAGWRGALAGLPGRAATALSRRTGIAPESLLAYVGPHVCEGRYEVSEDVAAAFAGAYPSSVTRPAHVDLGAAVSESLVSAGVRADRIAGAGVCTASETGRFYSYRAEGVTGRHCALACLTGSP